MLSWCHTHEEVIGFDIAVDELFRMEELNRVQHLHAQQDHRLQAETACVGREEILQRFPEEFHHQEIVALLC